MNDVLTNQADAQIFHNTVRTRELAEIETMLPTYKGKPFTKWIEDKLRHNLAVKVTHPLQKTVPVAVLDVGCGEGKLLDGLAKRYLFWRGNLQLMGLDIETNLNQKGVIQGNMEDLERLVKLNSVDILVCNQAIRYSPDPLKTLIGMYGVLRTNGILFVNRLFDDTPYCWKDGKKVPLTELFDHLRTQNVDIEPLGPDASIGSYSVAIRKSEAIPKLPIAYTNGPLITTIDGKKLSYHISWKD